MELGERIAQLRDGRSQTKIAELAGIDPATLNRIERGKNKNPSRQTLTAIARALGVETQDLLLSSDEEKTGSGAPAGWFDASPVGGGWYVSKELWDALGEHVQLLEAKLDETLVLLRDARRIAKDAEKTAEQAVAIAHDAKRTTLRRSRESA